MFQTYMVAVKRQTVSGASIPLWPADAGAAMASLSKLWLIGKSNVMYEFGIVAGRPKVMLKVLACISLTIQRMRNL